MLWYIRLGQDGAKCKDVPDVHVYYEYVNPAIQMSFNHVSDDISISTKQSSAKVELN